MLETFWRFFECFVGNNKEVARPKKSARDTARKSCAFGDSIGALSHFCSFSLTGCRNFWQNIT
jgi:hypothetical protein